MQLVGGRELLPRGLLQLGHHVVTLPGPFPVDLIDLARLGVELGLVSAGDILDETANQFLGEIHDVLGVNVSFAREPNKVFPKTLT